MIGAIIGDIIGSPYEYNNINTQSFPLFSSSSHYTDDTILSVAISDAILSNIGYKESLLYWANKYPCPYGDYGGYFLRWLKDEEHLPYNSYGNGSAMRVSSIGWLYDNEERVIQEAKQSSSITHNHPEGIKGAVAVALCIFWSRKGLSKIVIRQRIEERFNYDLSMNYEFLLKNYSDGDYNYSSCQDTVPQAIICFLESTSFEDAIRKAVSIGGDTDTLTCIAGAIAEAYYKKIDYKTLNRVYKQLSKDMFFIVRQFINRTKLSNDYRITLYYRLRCLFNI